MPRKSAAATDSEAPTSEPRRSTRISTLLPKVVPAQIVKAVQKRTGKKRSGEESEKDGGSKKVKATNGDAKESGDAAEGDEAEKDELAEDDADLDIKTIQIGDVLPSITLKNEKGEDVDAATLAQDKIVVIFLVPKADTPGCTQQACGFRDSYPDFTSLNAAVYCLSADSPTAQTKWQTKKNLPYPLLSDPNRVFIKALGAGDNNKTKRSHFIFEKGGKLVEKKIPVKPADSPKQALEFVKTLSA